MHERRKIRLVRDDDRDRAAEVMRTIFGEVPGKKLGTDRTSISRGMNGSDCNPANRMRRYARRAHEVGVPRERTQVLVVDVRVAIEEAYGDAIDFADACRRLRRAAGAADMVHLDAMADRSLLPEWVLRAKEHSAALDVAIAAAEREIHGAPARAA